MSDGIPTAPVSLPRPVPTRRATAGIPTPPAFLPRGRDFTTGRLRVTRSAFTLVELLVVIVILAMLASLVTVAASRAMTAARNAAIKAEIDMLHMAIMNYKNEYGGYPPCTTGTFGITGVDPASRHLARLFPRSQSALQAKCLPYLNNSSQPITAAGAITPDKSLLAWLYGYTDDPLMPVLGPEGTFLISGASPGIIEFSSPPSQRRKLYDFDATRVSNYQYFPRNQPGSPYIYISSSQVTLAVPSFVRFSLTLSYSGTTAAQLAEPGAHYMPANPLPAKPNVNCPDAWWFTNCTGSQQLFNPDSFQIMCAGRDGQFGTDDDLSNFWPGTRKDYLDSLNQ